MRRRKSRRKSILPALIIESIALMGLAGIYLGFQPHTVPTVTEPPMEPVPFVADSLRDFSDLHSPQVAPATQPVNERPPIVVAPPLPAGEMLYIR